MKSPKFALGLAALIAALPSTANATVTMSVNQVGSNVVVTTTGSLDMTSLSLDAPYPFNLSAGVAGSYSYLGTGVAGTTVYAYSPMVGPGSLGDGNIIEADFSEGAAFAINASFPAVFVAEDYLSGSSLAGSATFLNQTIASLGLDAGAYTFTTPSDSIFVNIGTAGAVPEPATWAMMIGGMSVVGGAMRRRRGTTKVSFA